MLELPKSLIDNLGFDFDTAIAEFKQALEDHKLTVDEPAPLSHPLVEQVVRDPEGYTVIDDTPPPLDPPGPVNIIVSDRQLAQALAEPEGGFQTITWEEATEWGARGVIPAVLMTVINTIPDELNRARAVMLCSAAKEYHLLSPMAFMLGQLMGWDEDRRRALWEYAASLNY